MARIRKRKGSDYYYCDYITASGERVQRSTHRIRAREAQQVADQWERESLRDPVELARERATVRTALDLLSTYLATSVRDGSMADDTARSYVEKAKRLREVFGEERLLSTINTAAVRDYCETRRKPREVTRRDGSTQAFPGASSHTLVKEVTVLKLMLRLAAERGLWTGSLETIQPVELSARYVPRTRVLTDEEVKRLRVELMRRSPGHWARCAFALATGAERRAQDRARREDIDAIGGWVQLRGTKRASRDRPVPLVLDRCRELLADALALADGDEVTPGATPMEQERERARPMFSPWPNASRDLAAACRRAGIPPVTLTDMRRSWATWHVEAGVSIDVLFRPMGHVDPTMLARTYAKPRREATRAQMESQVARFRQRT